MHRLARSILAAAVAAASAGCVVGPFNIPAILATVTPPATYTPVQPTPTFIPEPTFTPVQPTPTGPPTSTFTPIPTLTPPATPTTLALSALPATAVGFGNVSFMLPEGLASGVTSSMTTDVEFPFVNPSNGEMPLHTRFDLNGYAVQGTTLAAQVLVFPADAYSQYSDLTRQIISTLRTVQFYNGQPLPAGLPNGPFSAHVGSVEFTGGRGIRYLTQFNQAVAPANNRDLIYYLHGLTADGSSYVEVILPIQATFLTPGDNMDQGLPVGGIPFDTNHLSDYYAKVADKLNGTPPEQFMPPLSDLDALVQSISIK